MNEQPTDNKITAIRRLYSSIDDFSRGLFASQKLRDYQLEAAGPIVEAVKRGKGGQFVIVFSRQAGKDEMLAQLECLLLNLYQKRGGEIVIVAPVQQQANISRDRLQARMENTLNSANFTTRDGNKVRLGKATASFLSASPTANVRGYTASLLLLINEAQDVEPARYDAVFDPMAASTNAVTVFCGTPWTSDTLLARQTRYLKELESKDGIQRVFMADWVRVSESNPAYGQRVRERIKQFGDDHPFVRTEYRLLEIDGEGGLFPTWRRDLMRGSHSRVTTPDTAKCYCLLVDVAGGEEEADDAANYFDSGSAKESKRDSTVVTVVEIELPKHREQPRYRVVNRYAWINVGQSQLYGRILSLAQDVWKARYTVVDSTGIGAGLSSFLGKSLGKRLLPFQFGAVSKSQLGWGFCSVVDSGRYLDYAPDGEEDTRLFWKQLEACTYEVRPGPGHLLKWSVADPKLHDDLLISASLVHVLDACDWRPRSAIGIE